MGGIDIGFDGTVLRARLNRPQKLNAQTPATWSALAAIPELVATAECSLIVLSGEGLSFSAGLDRAMFSPGGIPGERSLVEVAMGSDEAIDTFIQQAQAGFTWPRVVSQPVVAYVQGHAIGAGCQLALAADIVVIAPDVQMALRETSLGLVPDLGITGPLVAAMGYHRAFELCASGRFMGAEELVSLGLATTVLPQEAWGHHEETLLQSLDQIPRGAIGDLKSLLHGATVTPEQLQRERSAQVRRLRSLVADLDP